MSRLDRMQQDIDRLKAVCELMADEIGLDVDRELIARKLRGREPSDWNEMRAVGRDPITGEASP